MMQPIDPMKCTREQIEHMLATRQLSIDVKYDTQIIDGKRTRSILLPPWLSKLDKYERFVAEVLAKMVVAFPHETIRIGVAAV